MECLPKNNSFKLLRFLDDKPLNFLVFWQMLFFNFLILKLKENRVFLILKLIG
jgi:hypothetical protein